MIDIQTEPIDPEEVLKSVVNPLGGAEVLFLGRVRSETDGREVVHLDYEAYGDMAQSELEDLVQQVRGANDVLGIAVSHRIGRLKVGEIAVAVAVSAEHRPEAFRACRWMIDKVKERVPIWKKECFEDGSKWVVEHP